MNQQHYTVFGIAITDKEGKEVEREYQAVASPRANFSQGGFYICLTEDPKIERGYQRTQKALEDLALEAAKYAIGLHQKFASDPMTWGEENFLTVFSSAPLPYEQGVDARGNRYAPFQLDKSWLEHFRNKFDEAYQGLMPPDKINIIPTTSPAGPGSTPPAGTPSSGSSGGLDPVEFRRQLEDSTRRDYAHIPRPPGFNLSRNQYQQLLENDEVPPEEAETMARFDDEGGALRGK